MQRALNKDLCTEGIKATSSAFLAQYIKSVSNARCHWPLVRRPHDYFAPVFSTVSISVLSLQAQETKTQEVVLQTNNAVPATVDTNISPNNGNVTADLLGLSEENNVRFICPIVFFRSANILGCT